MRKLLLAMVAMFFMAGLVIAGEVVIVATTRKRRSSRSRKTTRRRRTRSATRSSSFTTDKDGANPKDSDYDTFEKRVTNKKAVGGKLELTVKDDAVTEVKWKGKK